MTAYQLTSDQGYTLRHNAQRAARKVEGAEVYRAEDGLWHWRVPAEQPEIAASVDAFLQPRSAEEEQAAAEADGFDQRPGPETNGHAGHEPGPIGVREGHFQVAAHVTDHLLGEGPVFQVLGYEDEAAYSAGRFTRIADDLVNKEEALRIAEEALPQHAFVRVMDFCCSFRKILTNRTIEAQRLAEANGEVDPAEKYERGPDEVLGSGLTDAEVETAPATAIPRTEFAQDASVASNEELVRAAWDQARILDESGNPAVAWLLRTLADRLPAPAKKASRSPGRPRQERDWTQRPTITSQTNQHINRLLDRIEAARGDLAALEGICFRPSNTYYKLAARYRAALIEEAQGRAED